jgi:hypothetical protein
MMRPEPLPLSAAELEALHVLRTGMASTAPFTKTDKAKGTHCINGGVANKLIARGLARKVKQWRAVEITEAGRMALGTYK